MAGPRNRLFFHCEENSEIANVKYVLLYVLRAII